MAPARRYDEMPCKPCSCPSFILASRSPQRRQLLTDAGYSFTVITPRFKEPAVQQAGLSPIQHAETLAQDLFARLSGDRHHRRERPSVGRVSVEVVSAVDDARREAVALPDAALGEHTVRAGVVLFGVPRMPELQQTQFGEVEFSGKRELVVSSA